MAYLQQYSNFFETAVSTKPRSWMTHRVDAYSKAAESFDPHHLPCTDDVSAAFWNKKQLDDKSQDFQYQHVHCENDQFRKSEKRYSEENDIQEKRTPPYHHGRIHSGGHSSRQPFITRYTIEQPHDPNKGGVDIYSKGDDESNPVLDVDCGGNNGLLYVSKLCQGSKGALLINVLTCNCVAAMTLQKILASKEVKVEMFERLGTILPSQGHSIFFRDQWMTPNEFQFISGRETAKDWKRSIRHHGKSLKTLMSKGILLMHQPGCDCKHCKRQGSITAKKESNTKRCKRPNDVETSHHDAENTIDSNSSSTNSTLISEEIMNASNMNSSKLREEGSSNINTSPLLCEKAITGSEVTNGSVEESLDLRMRAPSRTSPESINGRNRVGESKAKVHEDGNDMMLMERSCFTKEEEKNLYRERLPSLKISNRRKFSNAKDKQDYGRRQASFHSNKGKKKNSDEQNSWSKSSYENRMAQSYKYPHDITPRLVNDYHKDNLNDYHFRCNDNLYDIRRLTAYNLSLREWRSPPSDQDSPQLPHPNRDKFIDLNSTSQSLRRHFDKFSPILDQLRIELTSQHQTSCNDQSFNHHDGSCHGNEDSHLFGAYKAPLTVLQDQSTQCEAPLFSTKDRFLNNSIYSRQSYLPPHLPHRSKIPNLGLHSVTLHRGDHDNRRKTKARKSAKSESAFQSLNNECNPRMVDLHDHAIPMVSPSSKKGRLLSMSDGHVSKENESIGRWNKRFGQMTRLKYPDKLTRMTALKNKMICNENTLRRMSYSAPPPPLLDRDTGSRLQKSFKKAAWKDRSGRVAFSKRNKLKFTFPHVAGTHSRFHRSRRPLSFMDSTSNEHNLFQRHNVCGIKSQQRHRSSKRYHKRVTAVDDMGEWSLDEVCKFLCIIGCDQYQQVFREHEIDGDALPLLYEHHLTEKMGLKVGHALKVIAQVHRFLGSRSRFLSKCFSISSNSK